MKTRVVGHVSCVKCFARLPQCACWRNPSMPATQASRVSTRGRVAMACLLLAAATLVVLHSAPPLSPSPGAPARDVCHTHAHADYTGDMAVVWGMNFLVPSAQACCDACVAHAAVCGEADANGKPFFDGAPHPCGHEQNKTCNMVLPCLFHTLCLSDPPCCSGCTAPAGAMRPPTAASPSISTSTSRGCAPSLPELPHNSPHLPRSAG